MLACILRLCLSRSLPWLVSRTRGSKHRDATRATFGGAGAASNTRRDARSSPLTRLKDWSPSSAVANATSNSALPLRRLEGVSHTLYHAPHEDLIRLGAVHSLGDLLEPCLQDRLLPPRRQQGWLLQGLQAPLEGVLPSAQAATRASKQREGVAEGSSESGAVWLCGRGR